MRISNSQINYQQQQAFRSQRELDEQQSVQQRWLRLGDNERQMGVRLSAEHDLSLTYENQQLSRLSSNTKITSAEQDKLTEIAYEQLVNKISQGQIEQHVSVNNILINQNDGQSRLANLNLSQIASNTEAGIIVQAEPNQNTNSAQLRVTQRGEYQEQSYHQLVSEGQIQLEDGRQIDFRLELELGRDYKEVGEINTHLEVEALIDPLVINFGGSAELLGSASFEFDIDSDGELDEIQQLQQGVGFLALDLNQDSQINDGQELFGTQSGNGFADLAQYDLDANGWIDENDAIYEQLSIYQPHALDGEPTQLSLKEAGVGAIYLGTQATEIDLKSETNELQAQIRQQGIFLKETGEVGVAAQIDFAKQGQTQQVAAGQEASLAQEFAEYGDKLKAEEAQNLTIEGRLINPGQLGGISLPQGIGAVSSGGVVLLNADSINLGQSSNQNRFIQATQAAQPAAQELGLEGEFILARFFEQQSQAARAELKQDFSRTEQQVSETELEPVDAVQASKDAVDEQIKQQAAQLIATAEAFRPQNSYQQNFELAQPKKTEQIIENILKPMLEQVIEKREKNIKAYQLQAKL